MPPINFHQLFTKILFVKDKDFVYGVANKIDVIRHGCDQSASFAPGRLFKSLKKHILIKLTSWL